VRIVAVDPVPEELFELADSIRNVHKGATVESFADPLAAVKYAYQNQVDALYTVTAMKRLSGFELGKLLRARSPGIQLNFIGEDENEKIDAMRILANSYIIKPVTADALRLAEAADW
jgi:DNA-binding response OmpR family regulator